MSGTDRKYYTVEAANRTLPLVSAIVRDIVELYSDVHERRERLARVRQRRGAARHDDNSLYSEELEHIERELDKDIDRLRAFTDELQKLGVELKDPVAGLVDFYSRMDDRDVYLCWKLGEEEIAYWHELDAGFAGRQSLLESSLSMGESETAGESS
jgi:hypothetical protein